MGKRAKMRARAKAQRHARRSRIAPNIHPQIRSDPTPTPAGPFAGIDRSAYILDDPYEEPADAPPIYFTLAPRRPSSRSMMAAIREAGGAIHRMAEAISRDTYAGHSRADVIAGLTGFLPAVAMMSPTVYRLLEERLAAENRSRLAAMDGHDDRVDAMAYAWGALRAGIEPMRAPGPVVPRCASCNAWHFPDRSCGSV